MSWLNWLQQGKARRSTFLETRRASLKRKAKSWNVRVTVGMLLSAVLLFAFVQASANAAPGDPAFEMYLDAPFVENSYVYTEHKDDPTPQVTLSTFDGQSDNNQPCEISGAQATLLSPGIGCVTQNSPDWGGAITESSDPTVGNFASGNDVPWNRYGQANGSLGVQIDFSSPQRYLGLWWSAGSDGNIMSFYDHGSLIATTSANDVATVIGTQTTYDSSQYLGNPAVWSENNGTFDHMGSYWHSENFVYLHFFAQGDVTFDRVVLSAPGNGFEFDNLVTSDLTGLTPSSRLVHVKSVTQPAVISFDANGGAGSIPNQSSADPIPNYCPDYSWHASSNCLDAPATNQDGNSPFYLDSWNTAANGSGHRFDPYQMADVAQNTILYAQWMTWYYFNPSPPGMDWEYQNKSMKPTDTVILPSEQTLDTPVTYDGYHIASWVYYDFVNSQDVVLGHPGDVISLDAFVTFMRSDYVLRAVWESNDTSTTPTAVVQTTIPVDPRVTSVTLPPMPLTDAPSASVCVDEVDSSHGVISSSLTFTVNGGAAASRTSTVTVTGTSALVAQGPRFLRYRVSPEADSSCSTANTYFVELRPLGLSDKRSSNADIN